MSKFFKYLSLLILVIIIILYFIPMSQKSFFELYKNIDNHSKDLKELRSKPLKSIVVDGIQWYYYSAGKGDSCLLFIHGMGGTYDFWWNQIKFFEPNYRVISYTLPKGIQSLKEAEKGILVLLDQENVDQFIPVGTSMGGYITQFLLKNHPQRIQKAVMSNTFPPNDFIIKENAFQRKIIPWLPTYVVGKFAEHHLKKDIFPTSENNELVQSFLMSVPFSKQELSNRFDIVVDFFEASPEKPLVKNIPKLIFESDNDPMITPELRSQLKTLYPEAQVHAFHNKGHFPYINAMDEYNIRLKQFLIDTVATKK